MKVWTMDPENFAIGSQLLHERKKGIADPEENHYEGEYFASLFLFDAFRSNQQHNSIGDVLECFVFSNVSVGRPAQRNLRQDEPEKKECWEVQGILRRSEERRAG